jgi:hypothetical protein
MKCKTIYSLFKIFSVILFTSLPFLSCESSRVGPELVNDDIVHTRLPPDNFILNGFVKDSSSKAVIIGASVKIAKADGTILTSILSDNSGKYSFDASNVNDNTLYVGASKFGYAYGTRAATLNKTANSASVTDILLTKLQVAITTITVVGGGTGSTPNTQSLSNQPLTVQVPANAVSSNIQLTVSSIPAGQVPQPANTSLAVLSAGQFGLSGTQFSQPVTITFPLPYHQNPGTVYPLWFLNESTGVYTNSGFSATVNADGTTASGQVNHFSTYVIQTTQGEITITLNTPSTSNGTEQVVALTSGLVEKHLDIINSVTLTCNGVNQEWLKDEVAGKLNFSLESGDQTTLIFTMSSLPDKYILNGVQVGPAGHETEKGNWEKRIYFALQTTTTPGSASGPGWTASITATSQTWVVTRWGWYWIPFDQDGNISGPY